MSKIDIANLKQALEENNEWLKQYVYDTITNFSATSMNVARILSHMANRTIHITKEDREIWDSAYDRAVKYADDTFKNMTSIQMERVSSLPTSNISSSVIYLLETSTDKVYEQWVYAGEWISLGTTSIDMDRFYTKEEIDAFISELKSTKMHVHSNMEILDLITAPFTMEDKAMLDRLMEGNTSGIADHINNDNVHMTRAEKDIIHELSVELINDISGHILNTAIHVDKAQVDNWDGMLDNAKQYVTEQIQNFLKVEYLNPGEDPSDPKGGILYIRAADIPTTENHFDKYIYVGGRLEPLGGGGGTPTDYVGVDFSEFVTTMAMQNYVTQHTHSHSNIDILNDITASFTEALKAKLEDTHDMINTHINTESLHVSVEEKSKIENMETTINTAISDAISGLFSYSEADIAYIVEGE